VKRFVDLRGTQVGMRFAWWDTVVDRFETHSDEMAWDTFEEFAEDYEGNELSRYRRLAPAWTHLG